MKIVVDQDKCTGHARCNAVAPDLYELDDNGYCAVTELQIPSGRESDAHAGADECPERAITITA
jgi:ferredoxin